MKKLFWRLNYFLNMAPSILHDLWDESELEYGFKHPRSSSKAEALQKFAKQMGVPFVDLPVTPVDPKDVYGMPTFVHRTDGDTITFLDELPECTPTTKRGIVEAAMFNKNVDVAIEALLKASDAQHKMPEQVLEEWKAHEELRKQLPPLPKVKKPRKKAKKAK